MDNITKIPSVDLRDFLSEDPERKVKFVGEIGDAYEKIGFVALQGHFLDDSLADWLYEHMREGNSILRAIHYPPITEEPKNTVRAAEHTNNKLVSTRHRVVNPPKEHWGEPRFSIPFLMHQVSDMKLDCLESCIDPKHPKKYKDINAGEFLDQRLKEIGLT